jgi:hypothetical protein
MLLMVLNGWVVIYKEDRGPSGGNRGGGYGGGGGGGNRGGGNRY